MNDRTQSADLFLDELPSDRKGSWRGQLFGNPSSGLDPVLTLALRFPWRGSVDVTIEGIPADVPSWREIEGIEVESTESGEPVDAWVYDGAHNFFEYARIQVLHQVGTMARFVVDLAEGEEFFLTLPNDEILEADQIYTTVDAEFEGIEMYLTADRELAEFTDPTGLVFDWAHGDCKFYKVVDSGNPEHSGQ
ncbi:hypothetical protein [Nocardia sp. NBC_00403]|uniref:hypothetical protein n=1 Tax=Nocardia sp. NBC_00403 TaxID=2975990 RepID=UPI002E1CDEE7